MTSVIYIQNGSEFEQLLTDAGSQLIVVDYFANWCKPCKVIAPKFEELSRLHQNVKFAKVDVDKHQDLAELYTVSSLPTFIFFRNGKMVDRFSGANQNTLQTKLQELMAQQPVPVDGLAASPEGGSTKNTSDLSHMLLLAQCECLNERDDYPLSCLLDTRAEQQTDGRYLLSDADAQLIIFVTFSAFVRLRGLEINGPEENGPKTVKIFLNKTNPPDFDSCESSEAIQTLSLEPKDLKKGSSVDLNFVKFQKVNTITLFIRDNQNDSEETRIDRLRFLGDPVNTTNMQNFKRVSGKKGENHDGV